jgi:hypothetical protein
LDAAPGAAEMILFFTLISIIAAGIGMYYLLGTGWKHLTTHERIDAVNACALLAVISILALVASFVWAPFK